MTMVLYPPWQADADLTRGRLSCRPCTQSLVPWGGLDPVGWPVPDGRKVQESPRRARCGGCGTTHVLLPAHLLPRSAAGVDLVGHALMDDAQGCLSVARQGRGDSIAAVSALPDRPPWRPTYPPLSPTQARTFGRMRRPR